MRPSGDGEGVIWPCCSSADCVGDCCGIGREAVVAPVAVIARSSSSSMISVSISSEFWQAVLFSTKKTAFSVSQKSLSHSSVM